MVPCALKDKLSSVYFLAELVIGHSGRQVLKPRHKESVLKLTSRPGPHELPGSVLPGHGNSVSRLHLTGDLWVRCVALEQGPVSHV